MGTIYIKKKQQTAPFKLIKTFRMIIICLKKITNKYNYLLSGFNLGIFYIIQHNIK